MKAMKVKNSQVAEFGSSSHILNYLMAQRYIKNEWSAVQLNGKKYKGKVIRLFGKTKGVIFCDSDIIND